MNIKKTPVKTRKYWDTHRQTQKVLSIVILNKSSRTQLQARDFGELRRTAQLTKNIRQVLFLYCPCFFMFALPFSRSASKRAHIVIEAIISSSLYHLKKNLEKFWIIILQTCTHIMAASEGPNSPFFCPFHGFLQISWFC